MANTLKYQERSFSVGDTIQVYQHVKEGDKDRTQMFEGILIGAKGEKNNKSFTVRKIAAAGIGVERIWPLFSPAIINIKLKKTGHVRRAKLYYLRNLAGKKVGKIKEKTIEEPKTEVKALSQSKKPANANQKSRLKSRKPGKKVSPK